MLHSIHSVNQLVTQKLDIAGIGWTAIRNDIVNLGYGKRVEETIHVYEFIKREHPTIGKGTIYRNLGILAEEGVIRRVEVPDGPARFDFTLKNHYHVRCIRCGNVSDVDMDELPDLEKRIRDTHGMKFLSYDIFFKAICAACLEKEQVSIAASELKNKEADGGKRNGSK